MSYTSLSFLTWYKSVGAGFWKLSGRNFCINVLPFVVGTKCNVQLIFAYFFIQQCFYLFIESLLPWYNVFWSHPSSTSSLQLPLVPLNLSISVGSRPHIRRYKMALTSCVLSGKQIICACAKDSSPLHVLCLPRDDNSADGLQPIREWHVLGGG